MKKLLFVLLGCLVMVGARIVLALLYPSGHAPIKSAAELSGELGFAVTFANFVLFVTQIGFAFVLASYNLSRADDLIGSRLLWAMSLGWLLKGIAFGCLAISVWFPLYRAWATATIGAALVSVPALYYYRRDMRMLKSRSPMRELERLTEKFRLDHQAIEAQEKPPAVILRETHDRLETFFAEMSAIAARGD